jgi:hypothetical protein
MTATLRAPNGTIIEAEGTPQEIAALAASLCVGRASSRVVFDPAEATTDPAQFFNAATCTCGRVDGCAQHPWLHRRVPVEAPLRH